MIATINSYRELVNFEIPNGANNHRGNERVVAASAAIIAKSFDVPYCVRRFNGISSLSIGKYS